MEKDHCLGDAEFANDKLVFVRQCNYGYIVKTGKGEKRKKFSVTAD